MTISPADDRPGKRTTRIRCSRLLQNRLNYVDQPSIQIAKTRDELEQAFSLIYREYINLGYITEPNSSHIYLTIYHILPETAVFIFKSYLTVISTLTHIFDSKVFGLPMDALYHNELNALRDEDRKLVELSALVTTSRARWRNIFMYLCRAIYWYSVYKNVDDLCIMVNPKHVKFYKSILFFEDLGPERHYPKMGAPAVALRLDLDNFRVKLRKEYGALDLEYNLRHFFLRVTDTDVKGHDNKVYLRKSKSLDIDTIRYFFIEKTNLLDTIKPFQLNYITSLYHGIGNDLVK